MRYCSRCVLPDTRPNLVLGPDGVCNACRNHGSRAAIDWKARIKSFAKVVQRAKNLGREYDCVIPVSGGKDSTWQVLTCLKFGLRPLAVTWKTPGRTKLGAENLANLVGLGVDHIDFQVNPRVEAKFMVETLRRCGTPAVPMHLALFNIPLKIAARFNVPLVVWGENSAFEYGSRREQDQGFRLNKAWIKAYGATHGTEAADWVSPRLSREELTPYFGPRPAELKRVLAVFMGYYFPWDPETSLKAAAARGFKRRREGPKTGYYDYADIDDDFISIHHFIKWYKFGFTRTFDNLSLEIRNKRLTREAAVEAIRRRKDETPHQDIERFCAFTGLSRKGFFAAVERFRNPKVWARREGRWVIPGFIIEDWNWP